MKWMTSTMSSRPLKRNDKEGIEIRMKVFTNTNNK